MTSSDRERYRLDSMYLTLSEGIIYRREPFGGLVYQPSCGTTVELDRGAFRLIELARNGVSIGAARRVIIAERLEESCDEEDLRRMVGLLREREILRRCAPPPGSELPGTSNIHRGTVKNHSSWPTGPSLTAPEAVHWAVTYRCKKDCPDCYAARHRDGYQAELAPNQAKNVIDRIASWGVFQLAIGGGEPLLREDLGTLVQYAARRGLTVHVTTSGDLLDSKKLESLAGSLTRLQIGINHHDLFGSARLRTVTRLGFLCDEATRLGLRLGANLMLCRTVLERFEEAIHTLVKAGIRRFVLLRYKPPASPEQWQREAPQGQELVGMEGRIAKVLSYHPGLEIRLDCALSFLERRLPAEQLRRAGLHGCVAGARILAIGPDGSVYPCSQLVAPRFLAGNIMHEEPDRIWSHSPVLARMRGFRAAISFRRSACGTCQAAEHCGGCHIFIHGGHGRDIGCPGPVPPSPDELPVLAEGADQT